MDEQHEEVEHIPWGELLAGADDGRRRILYLAAGALAALALAVIATRALSSPDPQPEPIPVVMETVPPATVPPVAAPPATAAPVETVAPETTVPPTPQTTTTVTEPILYREADLMAFPPDLALRAAVTRAEWFVSDYFTADLEPNGAADVRAALPAGVEMPEMPQDGAAGLSYVEWARAFRVTEQADGTYRVAVAYRLLGAPPDRGFYRLPVRAVEVRVAVSASGGSVVLDLPTPVSLPPGPTPEPWPSEGQIAPDEVVAGAMGAASGWGSEHRLVGTWPVARGWRVMLTATDEMGNRWPLVILVDGTGAPLG